MSELSLNCRIVDNMPITWCYDVSDEEQKYCSAGFPIGCFVTSASVPRDACVISVSDTLFLDLTGLAA